MKNVNKVAKAFQSRGRNDEQLIIILCVCFVEKLKLVYKDAFGSFVLTLTDALYALTFNMIS